MTCIAVKARITSAARTAAFLLSAGLALNAGSLLAAEGKETAATPASSTPLQNSVYVVDQDLRTLLTEFSKRIGANAIMSKGLKGPVKKAFLPTDRQEFLEEMSRNHGVEWYFEGTTLHLSSRDEMTSRLIGIKSLTVDRINSQIRKVDLDPTRYPLQAVPEANAAMITAPPSYIARVEVISESILKARRENGSDSIRFIKFGEKSSE